MRNLLININCWGNNYINGLLEYTVPCLLINCQILKKSELREINLIICTDKNGSNRIKRNKIYSELKLLINSEIILIEKLLSVLKKKTTSKYQLLACLQNLLINYGYKNKYKFIMTLYPDFIFKKETLKNLISLIKNKNSDILVPIPQLIKEDVASEIKLNGYKNFIENLADMNFYLLHEIIKKNDINNIYSNTPSLFCQIENNYINFSSYHIHPIIIKLNYNRFKYIPFTKSLDEDFIKALDYEETYHVVRDSDELLINSLLGEKDIEIIKQSFDKSLCISWINSLMYEINKKFSYSIYTIYKNSNIKKIKKTKKIIEFTKQINANLSLKNKANYHDHSEYMQNQYFQNIKEFLFNIHQETNKINNVEFKKLVKKNNLLDFYDFLKKFN